MGSKLGNFGLYELKTLYFPGFWQKMAPQETKMTTQNNRKRGRISMEMVSEVTLNPLRSFGAISGYFAALITQGWFGYFLTVERSERAKNKKKSKNFGLFFHSECTSSSCQMNINCT